MISARRIRRFFRARDLVIFVGLAAMTLVCILPVIWAVSTSFKGKDELYKAVPTLLPRHPNLESFRNVLATTGMQRMPLNLLNSLKITVFAVALQVTLASMAGYAAARLNFRGRDAIFYTFVFLMFIPRAGGLMASYELMNFLHLRNTLIGLALAYPSALSVAIFIMRQTYLAIPMELEEAAIIDGASTLQRFRHIGIPMGMAGMTVVGLFAFIYCWGEFLFALTMIDEERLLPAAVAVTMMAPAWTASISGTFHPYGAQTACQVLTMAPVVVIFILMQRWFVRGLTEGILKL